MSEPKPPASQYTSIGGQAVIEGVMMRSPHFVAVAVRRPDRRITIQSAPYLGIAHRLPWLKKPFLRGVTTLIESMSQGIRALSYSSGIAGGEDEGEQPLSSTAVALSIVTAMALALGLFVALPHLVTFGLSRFAPKALSINGPWFHLVDGIIRMAVLLAYVYLVAQVGEIQRVFQYHGAEHKSIYAFEAGEELTVENARRHSTLHPRCGTSFLLFLVLISIAVFSIVFPLVGFHTRPGHVLAGQLAMVLLKMVLMVPVAGLAYELIRLCACRMDHPVFRLLVFPGLVLQKLTTREPDDDQLEVALASLKQVLRLEKSGEEERGRTPVEEIFSTLGGIQHVPATVAEFPEL